VPQKESKLDPVKLQEISKKRRGAISLSRAAADELAKSLNVSLNDITAQSDNTSSK
jgi:hypothetical protein